MDNEANARLISNGRSVENSEGGMENEAAQPYASSYQEKSSDEIYDFIDLIDSSPNTDTPSTKKIIINQNSSIRFCKTCKKRVYALVDFVSITHAICGVDEAMFPCTNENPSEMEHCKLDSVSTRPASFRVFRDDISDHRIPAPVAFQIDESFVYKKSKIKIYASSSRRRGSER